MARNTEARIQAAIVAWLRMAAPDVIVFAVPNGGLRTRAESALMKWTGTLAGVPDLCLVMIGGRVAFLEVKAARGRLSEAQDAFLERLDDMSVPHATVRSIDDARAALFRWGIRTRERAAA